MVSKVEPEIRKCLACPNTFLVGGAGNKKRETVTCSWQCRDKVRWVRKGKTCSTLTTEQAAYMAGMLDADGHIGIYKHNSRYARVTVTVSNTDDPFLHWVKALTGVGSVCLQRKGTATTKPNYQWYCVSHAAVTFLEQILPYMHIKRARAELAIEYHRFLETPEGRLDTDTQLEYREQMLALNRRGPLPAAA
jgi:hypothetical protein